MKTWTEMAPKPPKLPDGKRWHVFLSYRSVNRPWVINLYDVLRELGFEVFLDQVVVKPADPLVSTLQDNLQASRSAVLVWSKPAAESPWVEAEFEMMATLAQTEGFFFVPLTLDVEPLPLWAQRFVGVDFRDYPDGPNGEELLQLLHGLVGKKLDPDTARFTTEQDQEARQTNNRVRAAIEAGNATFLREAPQGDELVWTTSSALGCAAAEGLTKLDDVEGALAVLDGVERRFPLSIRPKQLRALALARRGGDGDLAQAQDILGTLYQSGEKDPETVGIYARTFKDRHAQTQDDRFLRKARELYVEGFRGSPDDYYVGINAATLSVMIGGEDDLRLAEELAGEVQALVGTEPVPGDYWATATIGEVFLIRQDYEGAARLFQAAVDSAPMETGSHGTTWKQACRLMAKLGPTEDQRARVLAPFEHLGKDCSEVVSE
jgi:hypothetical protein